MKTTRTFNEGVDRLHEAHFKACEALEALQALTEKLSQSARRPETVDALNALQENLNSIISGLESAQRNIEGIEP
jgi:uncharacterized membrane protein YcjF (UPF0283 family)